jgi:hypothetical protein
MLTINDNGSSFDVLFEEQYRTWDLTVEYSDVSARVAGNDFVLVTPDREFRSKYSDITTNITNAGIDDLAAKVIARYSESITSESIILAASDETSDLGIETETITFRMPYSFKLTGVRASVTTAPTGASINIDVKEGGVSVLSTVITIDDGEKTSVTAATPPVISDTSLADDSVITIDIDQVGSIITGTGLKVTLIGNRT